MRTKIFLLSLILFFPTTVFAALTNPLGTTDLRVVIGNVITAILGLSGAIALLIFVWGGFQWMFSMGDPGKVKNGKETLKWAGIGLFIIVAAYVLTSALIKALTTGSVF